MLERSTWNLRSLVDRVYDAMTADVHALDIDVSGVTFCGSTKISAFLMMRQRAQEEGKTQRLVNLNRGSNACSRSLAYLSSSRTRPRRCPAGWLMELTLDWTGTAGPDRRV